MKPLTSERLADTAVAYRAALLTGRSPVEAVAAKFGIGYDAARQRIRRARRAGLLAQHSGVFDKTDPAR